MTMSDWITIIGAGITLIAMIVSMWQAKNALKSSRDAKKAVVAVRLAGIAERLKNAQEHVRDIAPHRLTLPGFKITNQVTLIQREFDEALGALPHSGEGSGARAKISAAQDASFKYEQSLASTPDTMAWEKMRKGLQDGMSEIFATTSNIGLNNE